jgi:predicted nucleotidyltransferase
MKSDLLNIIIQTLENNSYVIFAYLYGSAVDCDIYNDIDIAIYATNYENPFIISSDLKYELYKQTGIPADIFDIQIINDIPHKGNLFSLLYLKNIFDKGMLIVDKNPIVRADFMEQYSFKYRECEGLIAEVLS